MGYSLATGQDSGQRIPRQNVPVSGAVEGLFLNDQRLGLGNVAVTIRNLASNEAVLVRTTGDGIFRVVNVRPGRYSIRAVLEGYRTFERSNLVVRAGELVSVQVELLAAGVPAGTRIPEINPGPNYRKFSSAPGGGGPVRPAPTRSRSGSRSTLRSPTAGSSIGPTTIATGLTTNNPMCAGAYLTHTISIN